MTLGEIGMGLLMLAAVAVSSGCLLRVLALPTTDRVAARVRLLGEQLDEVLSDQKGLANEFRRLDSDVDEHLEQASLRLKKASTREANLRRQNGGAPPGADPAAPTLAQQFEAAENALWQDGS